MRLLLLPAQIDSSSAVGEPPPFPLPALRFDAPAVAMSDDPLRDHLRTLDDAALALSEALGGGVGRPPPLQPGTLFDPPPPPPPLAGAAALEWLRKTMAAEAPPPADDDDDGRARAGGSHGGQRCAPQR